MYSVMIVDDESIIREGLINFIDWNKFGYHIVAQAENGKKALEIAKNVKPQIILTDIYMPVMDGIEFAKHIKSQSPETVIIFLSGYNEFAYAQKALEIGIFRYLTKPIDEDELLLALSEAAKDMEHKELEQTQINKLKQLIRESLPLLKERFFLNLTKGRLKESEILNKLKYLNIEIPADRFFCMIISLDDYFSLVDKRSEDDTNLLKFAVQNISEEILSEIAGIFFTFEDKINEIGVLSCFKENGPLNFSSTLHPVLQKIQDSVRKYLETSVSIGIGRVYDSLAEASKSYSEAEDSLEYRTTFGKNSIIYINDIQPSGKHSIPAGIFDKVNDLLKSVKSCNSELSSEIVNDMIESLKAEGNVRKQHVHLIVIEIFNKFTRIMLEFDGDILEVYGSRFSPLSLLNLDTLEDLQYKLSELVKVTIEFVNAKRKNVNRNFIEKAKEFIHDNYMTEGLNLSSIADSVHVSPGYLSQLFKQVVGESCIEYLSKVRINQAKKLLKETNLKTYEIAYKIGYSDSQYFSTCFKKHEGVSPTDYRDIILKDIFDEK